MARHRTKKEIILKSTLELIADQGFHGMSMSDLAKHAGISPGTVYIYYKSKDELIIDLFHVIRLEMEEAILDEYDASLDLRSQYNLLMNNLIKYYIQNKHAFLFSSGKSDADNLLKNRLKWDKVPYSKKFLKNGKYF